MPQNRLNKQFNQYDYNTDPIISAHRRNVVPVPINPQHRAKLEAQKAANEADAVDPYWFAIAELGVFYGWEAILCVLPRLATDMSLDEMQELTRGARKVHAAHTRDLAYAQFIAAVSAQQKNPMQTFKKLSQGYDKAATL